MQAEPLFTKATDAFPQDLVKIRSHVIRFQIFLTAPKFDRLLGSSAAQLSAKFRSNTIIVTSNLVASRLLDILLIKRDKTSYRLVNRGGLRRFVYKSVSAVHQNPVHYVIHYIIAITMVGRSPDYICLCKHVIISVGSYCSNTFRKTAALVSIKRNGIRLSFLSLRSLHIMIYLHEQITTKHDFITSVYIFGI